MAKIGAYCFAGTTFTRSGEFDEAAFVQSLQRFIDADVGVYLCSGGGGEGHALTNDELRRVYEVGVKACKGKIPVHANPPERHTAWATKEQIRIAVDAGIEVVHMYHLAGWHAMKPTDAELNAYFDDVLGAIDHPITIAVNQTMGYLPSAALIAGVCNRHRQVVAVKLTGVPPTYMLDLRRLVSRSLDYHVGVVGSMNTLGLGATAIFGSEANVIPRTFRSYADQFEYGDIDALQQTYAQLLRFDQFVRKWNPSNPRWIKMAMRVLALPGGEGGVREPYMLPPEAEIEQFATGLMALGIAEITQQAKAAGRLA